MRVDSVQGVHEREDKSMSLVQNSYTTKGSWTTEEKQGRRGKLTKRHHPRLEMCMCLEKEERANPKGGGACINRGDRVVSLVGCRRGKVLPDQGKKLREIYCVNQCTGGGGGPGREGLGGGAPRGLGGGPTTPGGPLGGPGLWLGGGGGPGRGPGGGPPETFAGGGPGGGGPGGALLVAAGGGPGGGGRDAGGGGGAPGLPTGGGLAPGGGGGRFAGTACLLGGGAGVDFGAT
jgi:hypothetical protein